MNHEHSLSRRRFMTSTAGFAIAGASGLLLPRVSGIALAAEPTLQETTDWLLGKIANGTTYSYRYKSGNSVWAATTTFHVEADQGNWVVTEIDQATRDDWASKFTYTWTFSLNDFDPQNVVVKQEKTCSADTTLVNGTETYFSVNLNTTNAKPVIKMQTIQESGFRNKPATVDQQGLTVASCRINFTQEELARRVAKAFIHAITLSGGKVTKEVF